MSNDIKGRESDSSVSNVCVVRRTNKLEVGERAGVSTCATGFSILNRELTKPASLLPVPRDSTGFRFQTVQNFSYT